MDWGASVANRYNHITHQLYQLLVGHQPLNQEFAEALVEQIMIGIQK
ncbi:MAG: hypothetical protein V7L20_14510 [Nostoc sp.]